MKVAVVADCKGTLAGSFEPAIAGANAAFSELAGARPRSPNKPSAGVVGGSVGGATLTFTEYGCGDGSPGTMLSELERLLMEQGADVLIGPASGDEAVVAARWAKSHPSTTVVLGTAALQEPTMQIAPRNLFRYHGDAAQWNAGLGEMLYRTRGWRSAAVIADDYAPGWGSAGGFIADFCAIGGKIGRRVFPPAARPTGSRTYGSCPIRGPWTATSGRWEARARRRPSGHSSRCTGRCARSSMRALSPSGRRRTALCHRVSQVHTSVARVWPLACGRPRPPPTGRS